MANNFVNSEQVVGVNGIAYVSNDYVYGVVNGITKQLNCNNLAIIAPFWKIPWVVGTQVPKYTYESAINSSTPPRADAIKILEVKDTQDQTTYELAIGLTDYTDTASPPDQLAYLCNGNSGNLSTMPTAPLPFPIIQFPPTSVDDGTNTFTFSFPTNPLGLTYSIPAPWFDGVLGTPVFDTTGITTAALFVTWANSNWSLYGTWAHSGDIVTLETTTVALAGMQVALVPAAWCFDLTAFSTPALVNQVKFGSGGTVISVSPFVLTNNPAVLQAQLAKVMSPQSTNFSSNISHKLQVNTVYAQPILLDSGSTVATASAGVCS